MTEITGNLIAKDIRCSCRGYNLDKMLQPNILILLSKQDMHGYSIIQALESKNLFKGEKPDNTGVYRALRVLENRGVVSSEWDIDDPGPAKKIYRITDMGRECLYNWIDTLENYKKTIDMIIKEAKEVVGQ